MSGIDAVIAAARRPGGFAERKTFSLARSRAIEKMRKFALADPHMYVLEVVQSAVASGGAYIDVAVDGDTVTLSWVGSGHIAPDELGQLFDYLFASKDRVDLAHVRTLAVGVNAVLSFAPERIVVESGNPKTGEAARLEIRGGRDAMETVDLGKSDRRFSGTYVRIDGLGKGTHRWRGRGGEKEKFLLETRCSELPVPVVFNGEAMFGFASKRVPSLYRSGRKVSFDEGDLYGVLGLATNKDAEATRLMTHGVWIQSVVLPFVPGKAIGGIVNFDRLHKTVDHSGFVRDEVFEEMRLRLLPYAQQVATGVAQRVNTEVAVGADGEALNVADLRARLRQLSRVVLVDEALRSGQGGGQARARTIADAMDAEMLYVSPRAMRGVRALAVSACEVLVPNLDDDEDVLFFTQAVAGAPHGGMAFAPPVEQPPTPLAELLAQLAPADAPPQDLLSRFAGIQTVRSSIHAPRGRGPWDEGLWVRVLAFEREVACYLIHTAHAGFVLDVDVGRMSPADLRRPLAPSSPNPMAETLASVMADRAIEGMTELGRRVLSVVGVGDIHPGSAGAHLLLAAVGRGALVQFLRRHQQGLHIELALPRAPEQFDPLEVPVVETTLGERLGLRAVAALMDRCGGTLYGTRRDVIEPDMQGLDPAMVLALDAASEQALIDIFGAPAYVRVDAREVIARASSLCVRDDAFGIRAEPTPAEALPDGFEVEVDDGRGRVAPLEALSGEVLDALLEGLWTASRAGAAQRRRPTVSDDEDERSRQATMHLRRTAFARLGTGELEMDDPLRALVLGWGLDDLPWTVGMLADRLSSTGAEPIDLHYDRALRPYWCEGAVTSSSTILVDPIVGHMVTELSTGIGSMPGLESLVFATAVGFRPGGVAAGSTDARPASDEDRFMVEVELDERSLKGTVGILPGGPAQRGRDTLLVYGHDGELIGGLPTFVERLGVSGVLVVGAGVPDLEETLVAALERAADMLWPRLVAQLSGASEEGLDGLVDRLFSHLEAHLQLLALPNGSVVPRFGRASAEMVASRSIVRLERGAPISPRRLVERWSQALRRGLADEDVVAALGLSPGSAGARFARQQLVRWRVFRPPSKAAKPVHEASVSPKPWAEVAVPADVLAANLTHWLDVLRPDDHRAGRRVDLRLVGAGGRREEGVDAVEVFGPRVLLDMHHPLVKDLLEGRGGVAAHARGLARLLAVCYGRINGVHYEVTNEHELEFLVRLGRALENGELELLHGSGLRSPPIQITRSHDSSGDAGFTTRC